MTARLREVVLASSATSLQVHDVQTGASITTLKKELDQVHAGERTSKLADFVPARDGLAPSIVSVGGPGKGSVSVWSFSKDGPLQKSLMPIRLTVISLSSTGTYLAGGTAEGRVLIWETGSGLLLAAFDAHFRSVGALAWSMDDAALITGGDDAAAHVWSIASMLSVSRPPLTRPAPFCRLTDHTLPVTDIVVGTGFFPRLKVFTSSLDGSVKVWDVSMPETPLQLSFSFSQPSPISRIALDPAERYFLAAIGKTVKRVEMYKPSTDSLQFNATPAGALTRGTFERVDDLVSKSTTCSAPITAMHLSSLSPSLALGLATGEVQILVLPSLQVVRTIAASTSPAPIGYITTFIKPNELEGRAMLSVGRDVIEPLPPRPFAQLQRSVDTSSARSSDHTVYMRLNSHRDVGALIEPPSVPLLPSSITSSVATQGRASGGGGSSSTQLAQLQAENDKLREQLGRAISLNDTMWKGLVDGALAPIVAAPARHQQQ